MSRRDSADWAAVAAWADVLASTIASQHDHQYVAVVIRDDATDNLCLAGQRSGAGVDLAASVETVFPLHGSICGRVFRTGVAALLSDVRMDPDYLPFLGATMRSEVVAPIRVGAKVVGVVNLESPLVSAFDIVDLDDLVARIGDAIRTFPAG